MNKILQATAMSLLILFNANSQAEVQWDPARKLATLIADGAIPSKVIGKYKADYKILIADDSKLIVALQDSEGGCVIIFPSTHNFAFFKTKNFVICPPISLAGNNGKSIFWENATLDPKKSNKVFFELCFHRKGDVRTDVVVINRHDKGSLADWKFNMVD